MNVYLCGPINGCSDDECTTWRNEAKLFLRHTIDPMRRDYRGKESESVRDVVELDKFDIARSDALLVYFDRPSVGTSMEILWAFERGKLVALVNASKAALSPWLAYHSHRTFPDIKSASDWLNSFSAKDKTDD